MGEILFWIEAVVASILFVATTLAVTARIRLNLIRWLCRVIFVTVPAAFWCLFITFADGYHDAYGGGISFLHSILISAIVFAIGAIMVCILSAVKIREDGSPIRYRRANRWSVGYLSAGLALALVLLFGTLSDLDRTVRQEMSAVRAEAVFLGETVTPDHIAAEQNAAPLYEQAFETLMAQDAHWHDTISDEWKNRHKLSDQTPPALATFLANAEPTINLLEQAAAKPGIDYNMALVTKINTLIPKLTDHRLATKLLGLSAVSSAFKGDTENAIRCLNISQKSAQHVARIPYVICTLVAMAEDDLTLKSIKTLATDESSVDNIIAEIAIGNELSYQHVFRRNLQQDESVQLWLFGEPNNEEIKKILSECDLDTSDCTGTLTHQLYRVFLWREDLAGHRQVFEQLHRMAWKPYYKSKPLWEQLNDRMGSKEVGGFLVDKLTPSFSRAAAVIAQGDARRRLCRLAVAVAKYHRDNARYPESLGKLVPEYIEAVPVDPFTGEYMKTTRSSNGAFTIYSIGRDMADNKGLEWDNKKDVGDLTITFGKAD